MRIQKVDTYTFRKMVTEAMIRVLEGNIIKERGMSREEAENAIRKATRAHFEKADYDITNVELAEHELDIITDAFGKEVEDTWLDDDNLNWMCSVIGDELIKMGGNYDTNNVDKHKKALRDGLKEQMTPKA